TELLLGSLIIAAIAFTAIINIQNKMDKTYSDFAQLMTGTLAIQASSFEDLEPDIKKQYLAHESALLLDRHNDISFVEYKDKNNNIIYSSKKDFPIADENTIVNVSSPIIYNNNITGYVSVGMTGQYIKPISVAVKRSLFGIFLLAWLTFAVILLLNIVFVSKELKKIYDGVKQITVGKFGYTLESENMAELTEAFNDMSNILSKYEEQNIEQLTLERNKLEAVLMSIINGVIVCDNLDNVVLSNSAALKMLDIEEKQFIGMKIQNYIDSHGQKCFLEKIEEFKDTPLNIIEQKPIEFNIEAGKLTIKSMISPMFSKQQDYVGYIIVLIDVTRETEVNKLKNTFISNVSHELRTPVTVLRTYIDTLCNNSDDFDEQTKKEFIQTADKEAKRLHTMVNDILDFSRLESGSIKLKKEYSNIVELIEQNINSIKILADEKNIKINLEKEENIINVPINIESIDRVIRNLLSNAIKYSGEGKNITVSVKKSKDLDFVMFSVKDNGIGIAKEHLEKIFDRFYRIENATHTIKGTGLGLHLVKITVENYHHGKITVESKENEGSAFTVYLPLKIDENELV
ncbi:MAG: cell wall metabolism sensor histidine kinase WalK, partial [Candidatus Gastranaerophilales bacterium]|nr:cell wall metabolism sensor histidine kinase WalK [Candidatus Gastranaerophilales bacterium]